MSFKRKISLIALCMAAASPSWALSPQAEADMLKLEIKQNLDKDVWDASLLQKFMRIAELKMGNGESFEFLWGKLCLKSQDYICATTHLEAYVSRYGAKGKYYEESLRLLSDTKTGRENAQKAITAMNDRLREVSPTVLLDKKWNLHWTRSDNGPVLNFQQAQMHCSGLGEGWSLPTAEQLQSLVVENLPLARCGSSMCHASGLFTLAGDLYWSSDTDGVSVGFFSGRVLSRKTWNWSNFDALETRALCVRRL